MTEENFNKESFSHGILLKASPEKVYEYISTGSGLSKWFIGSADYFYNDKSIRLGDEPAQKGNSFLWKWLKKDLELKGIITESDGKNEFGFTFGSSFFVNIKLSESGDRTKLVLTQCYQDSATENEFGFINCCVCWVFFLTNLKSVLEHGIDLRETEADIEMLVNR
ncbi:MAG TPA: SRPBCC domain-containing protein [Ignavibacteria bacterium]|nr:SRPBCC domain-containing protein [Ignavibacteria bacterium]HQY51430.1 SRPBCC domain-containing protein [Ignavibacteria bacterium]